MSIAEVASAIAFGANGGTTGVINNTGADLTVVIIPYSTAGTTPALSDHYGNTYVFDRNDTNGPDITGMLYYHCFSPTVGAAADFTIAGAGSLSVLLVDNFSGVGGTGLSAVGNTQTSGATIQPGSVTPLPDDGTGLFVSGSMGVDTAPTVNSSFIVTQSVAVSGGVHYSGAIAYKLTSAPGAENPTWSDSSLMIAANLESYFASTSVATVKQLTNLGVG